jgi:hypothetical protein
VTALKSVSQLFVIDSEEVKKGCLKIVDVNRVVGDVEPNIVRLSIGYPGLHTTTSHPNCKGVGVMISAPSSTIIQTSLKKGCAAKFASPNYESFVEKPSLFQILDETC